MTAAAAAGPHLHDRAQFFGEQRRQRIGRRCVECYVQAAARSERHFRKCREQAAIGDVVIGEQRPLRMQALHQGRRRRRAPAGRPGRARRCRAVHRPARAPTRQDVAGPRPARCAGSAVSPRSRRNNGVSVLRASGTGANAETIKRYGRRHGLGHAVVVPRRAHGHRVLAHRNRETDGDAGVHRHGAHGVVQRGVLARMPGRRHPVGRKLDVSESANACSGQVGDRFAHRHAPGRRRVDQRQRRAFAHRHRLARIAFEVHQRHGDVGHWHLPGSDHRIARTQSADGAIADRHEKRLVGDRGELQHAVRRVPDRDAGKVERRQRARDVRHVAGHHRRFAEDHVQRHVDGTIAEMRVGDDKHAFRIGAPHHRERTALAFAQRSEFIQRLRSYRKHVALLRLVAPDLARRHPGFLRRHRAQIERSADAAAMHQFRQRVGQPAGADVMQRQDRIAVAQLPAAVDDFLRTAFDFRVAALHRIEIEVGRVRAGRHRRRRAAAHADQQSGAAQLDQQRAGAQRMLVRMLGANVAQAAGNHDRLVVAADLARDPLLERAEIAGEIGAPEFVVERRRADRPFEHDRQCRGDAVGLAVVGFPCLRECGNAQMRNGESDEAGLRLAADARCALIADLAAGAGGGTGKWRDGGRVVVRLDLHQDVCRLAARAVEAVVTRIEARDRRTFHDRRVVGVGDHRSLRMRRVRFADHAEQASRLLYTVDDVLRVEDLVSAMLGIGLREHHQLDVGRVATERSEPRVEVVDLVRRERQAEAHVGALQCRAAFLQQRDGRHRPGREMGEQLPGFREIGEHRLDHPVVQQRQQRCAIAVSERCAVGSRNVVDDAAFYARDGRQAAVPRDVGRLGRPRRQRAGTRDDEERRFRGGCRRCRIRAVGQQAVERRTLVRAQRARNLDEMAVVCGDRGDAMHGTDSGEALQQLGQAEIRQRRPAGQREDFGHRGWGCA